MLEHAAHVAERLGEHAVAEQCARQLLARGTEHPCALMIAPVHALLGRAAARRGHRAAAVVQWRKAAAAAMSGRAHLLALLAGWECGGAEGRAMAEAACAAMGREESVVLAELRAAGAEFNDGRTAATIVIAEAASSSADVERPRLAKDVLMDCLAVCLTCYMKYKVVGYSPEARLTVPTAEEIADGDEAQISALEILREWVPQWRRLDDATERIVGGISTYGHCGCVYSWNTRAIARWYWDSGMLDEMGGLAAWQRTWRGYDFHAHHALLKAAMADTYDHFLVGAAMMPWLLGAWASETS